MKRVLAIWLAAMICLCGPVPRGWAEEPVPEAAEEYIPLENEGSDEAAPAPSGDDPDGSEQEPSEPGNDAGPETGPKTEAPETDGNPQPDCAEDENGQITESESDNADEIASAAGEMPEEPYTEDGDSGPEDTETSEAADDRATSGQTGEEKETEDTEEPEIPETAAVSETGDNENDLPEDVTETPDAAAEDGGPAQEETEDDIIHDITDDVTDDIADDTVINTTDDIPGDTEEDTVNDIKDDDEIDTADGTPDDVTDDILGDTAEDTENDIIDDVENDAIDGIKDDITDDSIVDITDNTGNDIKDEVLNDTADGTSEDIADDSAGDIAEDTGNDTEDSIADDAADDITDDITDDTENDITTDTGSKEGTEGALPPQPEEGELVLEIEDISELTVSGPDGGDAEALLRAYLEKLLRESLNRPGMLRSIRVDGRLDETCLALYQQLKPRIEAIAAGSQSSTELSVSYEDLGLPTRFTAEELGITIAGQQDIYAGANLVAQQVKVNYALVQLALLANCPYELYWYDKSAGARTTGTPAMRVRRVNGEYVYEITGSYNVRMTVSGDYGTDTYRVDTSVGQRVQRSIGTAQQIVEKYKDLNDLEKLEAYRDEICRLAAYNGSAAGGGRPYGDPWQLIYVFDEDSGTNVVCEGYAKAFQYLCDMTRFDGDVNCYTVTGRLEWGTGEGTHMWNIVTMSDGQNYLVDLTNSDSGTVGSDGSLFLVGEAEEDGGALIFHNEKGQTVRYQYNDDTVSLYTPEELTLSGKKYEPKCHLDLYPYHTLVEYPRIAPTCEEDGRKAYWYCRQDGRLFTDAHGTSELAEDELGIPAPGHRLEKVSARAATYAAEGRIVHWRCAVCGKLFADAAGQTGLTAGETVVPKKARRIAPVQEASAVTDSLNALSGWRITRIAELLTQSELRRFQQLSLTGQLSVLAAVLSGDARAAEEEGAAILREIADDPARAAAFRTVYPAAGPGQAYRVELVNTENGERRTVLITVDGNGVFTAGRP